MKVDYVPKKKGDEPQIRDVVSCFDKDCANIRPPKPNDTQYSVISHNQERFCRLGTNPASRSLHACESEDHDTRSTVFQQAIEQRIRQFR